MPTTQETQQPRQPLPKDETRQITDKSIIPFLKENRDKNRLAKIKTIFDNSTELKNEFLNFVQSIIDKEEVIRNINALKENIYNSDLFKNLSYICHVLQSFSKSHELNNFIIQLQKLPDTPLFQFANKINNLYEHLQLPWELQEAYNLKFFNAINAHDSKQIKDVIDEIYKDQGLILSKKSITKYFIDEYIFISREHKDIKELCKDRVVINALEKLKRENKQYQNISLEDGINQAFSYFKEVEQKELPTINKVDDKQNQYLRSYKIAHGDYCYIISNNINNAFFYCNGKFANSTSKTIKINGEEKQFHQITINHLEKHYIYIYSPSEIKMQAIHGQMWALLLQGINNIVIKNKDEIKEAIKAERILEENYRTGKISINEFVALKNPSDFVQFRCKKASPIQSFCDMLAEISIKARYKDQYEWKEFDSKLFDSIRINDNNEIEYTLTDEYIKMNRLTLSSQVSFPISAFEKANLTNYKYIFNIYVLLFIHNRINANNKEKRVLTMSKFMDWLGFDIVALKENDNMDRLPNKNYKYLNELNNKLGLSILFDNKNLEVLKNYKWTSKKIRKDTQKEFEEKKITFSFDDKMEKILRNNTPKSVNEYREEAKELKKQK